MTALVLLLTVALAALVVGKQLDDRRAHARVPGRDHRR